MVENNNLINSFEIEKLPDKYEIVGPNKDIDYIGIVTTYGTSDLKGDIMQKGAFTNGIQSKPNVPLLFNHNAGYAENILGGAFLYENEAQDRVIAEIRLNKNNSVSDVIKQSIDNGYLNELSIGGNVSDLSFIDPFSPTSGTLVKEATIFEVSLVLQGANPNAIINPEDTLSIQKDITYPKMPTVDENNQVDINKSESNNIENKTDQPENKKTDDTDKKTDDVNNQKVDDINDKKVDDQAKVVENKDTSKDDKKYDELKKSIDALTKENNLLKSKIELLSD